MILPRHHGYLLVALILMFAASPALFADIAVIDFEGLSDGTFVTTQFPGVTFSNAIIATAGISLNELEFPPKSGVNVVIDFGGPISVSFATPISTFEGFFTYLEPVTIQGFDASDNLLGSSSSLFSNNLACLDGPPCSGDPGSSPNEPIQLDSAGNISSVVITGDPAGFSFALDDVTYSSGPITVTPEPKLVLLTGILFFLIVWQTAKAGRAHRETPAQGVNSRVRI
jgi:hypothetical protein